MNLGIIGCGAIGSDVARAADSMPDIDAIYLCDTNKTASEKLCKQLKKAHIEPVERFLAHVDVVFEAASQQAVHQYGMKTLEAGKDLIIMSIGSLFDDAFRAHLIEAARKHHRRIYLPSGAVCGIDGVVAANVEKLDSVTLVTTKSPVSLGTSVDERTVVFKGTAREAVTRFPRNINVAACLSLAGVGFDDTKVEIVADPVETRINHKILAHGRFGRLRAEVENMPHPDNPQSSYMASLSAIATLRRVVNPLQIA
ncbi:MAG: aspartate dehydrogenase [Candidatus Thermoplasmatota archaeon]|nr:aspartate dehydrogenase [Candidatus Thermoplasmatota archaeon]